MLSVTRRSVGLGRRARRWLHGGASAGLALCAIGCGSDSLLNGPAVDINGGERLAWSQAAASAQEVQRFTFRLYVTGRPMQLVAPACHPTPSEGGFTCSGGLPPLGPGRHLLELTSTLDGSESPRSTPLLVNVTGPAAPSSVSAAATPAAAAPSSQSRDDVADGTVCARGALGSCYAARVVAQDLGPIDGMAATPDGRVLFIEAGIRVRVATGEGLALEPALVLPDPTARIVGLAVDTGFVESRSVFVAWTQDTVGADGAGSILNITRYREVGNILAQGAQIVTGLQVGPAAATVPLAVDDSGLLYVATPRVWSAATGDTLQEGLVLRFDRDGRTPAANPRASPVLSYGLPQPTGLALDPVTQRVWLGGGAVDGPLLASVAPASEPASWPVLPQPSDTSPIEAGGSSRPGRVAIAYGSEPRPLLLLAAGARLWLAVSGVDGQLDATSELPLGLHAGALAAGFEGAWYVAEGDGQTARVWLLARVG